MAFLWNEKMILCMSEKYLGGKLKEIANISYLKTTFQCVAR